MNNKYYDLYCNGKCYQVKAVKDRYDYGNNLAIFLLTKENEMFCVLTVNLEDNQFDFPNLAYVDTNNCPFAEKFITENKLGKFKNQYGFSGFCRYPLYEFDLSKLNEE